MTDGYSKLREDVQYRKEVAGKIGLGFEISAQTPDVVPNVPRSGCKTLATSFGFSDLRWCEGGFATSSSLELAVTQQNAA